MKARAGLRTIFSMLRSSRQFLASGLLAVMVCMAVCAQAQDRGSDLRLQEQKIKAGLVYSFLKYTAWPAKVRDSASMHICLYGGDPFDGYFYPLRGRTARHKIIIITEVDSINEARSCHLLYIHHSQEKNLPALLGHLQGSPILTASDIHDFVEKGGMVEFGRRDRRVSVFVNRNAMAAAGLDIDNRLLTFAKSVSAATESDEGKQ
jgi:hypothetical protein